MPEVVMDLLAGVASLFDFRDAANDDMDIRRPEGDDYNIMREDWSLVSTDFWEAIDCHESEEVKARV